MPGTSPLLSGLDFRRGLCARGRRQCRAGRAFSGTWPRLVMPGLVPGIHVPPPPRPCPARTAMPQHVDARNKSGHDGRTEETPRVSRPPMWRTRSCMQPSLPTRPAFADRNADRPAESANVDSPARHLWGANVDPAAICLPDAYPDAGKRMESTSCALSANSSRTAAVPTGTDTLYSPATSISVWPASRCRRWFSSTARWISGETSTSRAKSARERSGANQANRWGCSRPTG